MLRRSLMFAAILSIAPHAFAQAAGAPPPSVTPPAVLTHVDAVYPESSLAARQHGDVVLALTVDVDGHVSKVDVMQSGGAAFDEAATIAARQWTFTPARRDGKPVASRIRVPFHFAPPAPPPELVPEPPKAEPEVPTQTAALPAPRAASPTAATAPAHARAATEGEASEEGEEVYVTGRLPSPSRGASDFDIKTGELARVPRQNSTEFLKLAPGILLTNEGGEGHAEQVFLRGFDAREGQDIELTVGGVPINESGNLHGNGYADTHFIIPELVDSIRVIEGPFDPRQGNYAVAGSADYELALYKRGLTAKYTGGSYGTQRLLLTFGPREESARTFAAAEVYTTDGYGQNRDAQRATAMTQYEGKLGKSGSYRVGATAYATHYHSAGVIREDDYKAGRIGFYDSYALSSFAYDVTKPGGDASRYTLYGDVQTRAGDTTFSQQVFVVERDMRLIENFTGFLLDVQEPLQSPHDQRGDTLDLDVHEVTFGARGSSSMTGKLLGQKQTLELGYFARGDRVSGEQQRLEAATGHPYLTDANLVSELGDLGLYADASLKPLAWLTLRGGLRADLFTFNVNDLCAVQQVAHPSTVNPPIDQSCLSEQDFGRPREPNQRASTASTALLPRASLIVGPYRHFSFSASYGKGVRSVDPSYVTQDTGTPFASVVAYEGGVTYAGSVGSTQLTARSIVFQTHVDKDLIFSETAGRNVLGAGTTRTGWVGATRLSGVHFDQSLNVTLVRSLYDDTHLLVAYAPDVVVRSDSAYVTELPFRLSGSTAQGSLGMGLSYVGPRPLPYGQRSDTIFTVDLSAQVSVSHYELGLSATNLLGTRYRLGEYNYASNFNGGGSGQQPTLVPERHFTAGAPRTIFASVAINFGGA
ncbi:MAG TPA: TonB family protein [Polyangiaceae bacterium]|nr:TonB family protein [Polyangiaceae bacterium]